MCIQMCIHAACFSFRWRVVNHVYVVPKEERQSHIKSDGVVASVYVGGGGRRCHL
jgi:hypothetical protein